MKLLFLGTWEIILIVIVVLLLFGGKKIPELMKGLGKGVKSFKDGVNGVEDFETSRHQDFETSSQRNFETSRHQDNEKKSE